LFRLVVIAFSVDNFDEATGFFATNTSKNLLRGLSTVLRPSDENIGTFCRHDINSSDFARVIAT
jgi:hypothetical protein